MERQQKKLPDSNTACFSEKGFSKIQEIMHVHKFNAGSKVFWEGDSAEKLYFVKSGSIRLTKLTDEGKDLFLYYFHTGDLSGEFDYSDQKKVRMFSAEVLRDSQIGVIKQRDLESLLWKNGSLAVEFSKWLSYMQQLTQFKLNLDTFLWF